MFFISQIFIIFIRCETTVYITRDRLTRQKQSHQMSLSIRLCSLFCRINYHDRSEIGAWTNIQKIKVCMIMMIIFSLSLFLSVLFLSLSLLEAVWKWGLRIAAIALLYPMETNKIVEHDDNIHVICHFHFEHFYFFDKHFHSFASHCGALLRKMNPLGTVIPNQIKRNGSASDTQKETRAERKRTSGEMKELNCQKELSSALAKNSFEHFWNAIGYHRENYRVWQFEHFIFGMYHCCFGCCCCCWCGQYKGLLILIHNPFLSTDKTTNN